MRTRTGAATLRAAALIAALALGALAAAGPAGGDTLPARAHVHAAPGAPAAVKGLDEAGVSTGTGDDFTAAQWKKIAKAGFKVFITDPVDWSSECSDGNCTEPVSTCTIDPAAVKQIQDAINAGLDIAVYTRNPGCLTAAITGLSSTQRQDLSFAVLDIETDPSVPPSESLVSDVKALGVTPVFYSYQSAWESITGNTTAYDGYALQDGEVPDWNATFPAPHPPGYPSLVTMPDPYGGWSGYADIEQQQCCTDVAGIRRSSDQVDLDSVNAAWLASLPQNPAALRRDGGVR
jgi:hypothetical protein